MSVLQLPMKDLDWEIGKAIQLRELQEKPV